jgi:GTP cyclohydrolase I
VNTKLGEDAVRTLIESIGEDPNREGLIKTPHRYFKALADVTAGYRQDPVKILNSAKFTETYNSMIVVKDIEFYSLCEHHILPFFGSIHIAYIPNGQIVGLSKLPRVAEVFARRLQVQERLTEQIAHTIQEVLKPKGVAVVIEAKHMCMVMRGVQKQNSSMTTSCMLGEFLELPQTRNEFMKLIGSS